MNILARKYRQGMSTVELMIAIGILGLLMGVLGMMISKTFFINRYTFEQGLNNAQLQRALNDFSETLREAKQADSGEYLIKSADDFDIVLFANIDDDDSTEQVHYYLDDGILWRGTSEASGFPPVYPANDQEVEEVGRGIVNTTEQPIFYYYNDDYPQDTTNNPLSTPAQVESISLVEIDIYANIDPNHSPDTQRMETFVKPRNIE